MKQVIFGIVCTALVSLALMGTMTAQGNMARQNDLDDNLATAANEVLSNLMETNEYSIDSEEELIADFCQSLIQEISIGTEEVYDENQTVTVEVAGVDIEKGLLCLRVTETYTHTNGNIGTITCDVTAIFEQQVEKESYTVTYMVDDELYVAYSVQEGDTIVVPSTNPTKSGKTFSGWRNSSTKVMLNASSTSTQTVTKDLTYVAVFK